MGVSKLNTPAQEQEGEGEENSLYTEAEMDERIQRLDAFLDERLPTIDQALKGLLVRFGKNLPN